MTGDDVPCTAEGLTFLLQCFYYVFFQVIIVMVQGRLLTARGLVTPAHEVLTPNTSFVES